MPNYLFNRWNYLKFIKMFNNVIQDTIQKFREFIYLKKLLISYNFPLLKEMMEANC